MKWIYTTLTLFVTVYSIMICPSSILAAGSTAVVQWTNNEHGSISPINLTIWRIKRHIVLENPNWTQENNPPVLTKEEMMRIINHGAAGVYEMSNGTHRLGRIKVIEGDGIGNEKEAPAPENYHINWHYDWRNGF